MNKDRRSEKVVVVAKDVVRFEASADSKIGEQFRNIQSEKERQSTVFLDEQKETFQPPDTV